MYFTTREEIVKIGDQIFLRTFLYIGSRKFILVVRIAAAKIPYWIELSSAFPVIKRQEKCDPMTVRYLRSREAVFFIQFKFWGMFVRLFSSSSRSEIRL